MTTRAAMQPIGKWRAYFAPVERASGVTERFDPKAEFDVDAPPAPWRDLGWIKNFERSASVELEHVATGTDGLKRLRFRKNCEGKLAFDFAEWGKLQLALASSSQHINVLAGESYAVTPLGPKELQASAEAVNAFSEGDLVVVDVDLEMQTGFVGTGVSGAYVKEASQVGVDYVRATSYNVARVEGKTATSLVLEDVVAGGVVSSGAKVQKVVGFVDREGASFLQEWSALFVLDELAGGRVVFWYPRLQAQAESGEVCETVDTDAQQLALHGKYVALPVVDDLDGESVVSYRFYFPATAAPAY